MSSESVVPNQVAVAVEPAAEVVAVEPAAEVVAVELAVEPTIAVDPDVIAEPVAEAPKVYIRRW